MGTGNSLIRQILEFTAWRMDTPRMYGAFHIAVVCAVVISAIAGALVVKRRYGLRNGNACEGNTGSDCEPDGTHSANEGGIIRILAVCGWILAAMELYKQLFLYFVVNGGAYDWWYFPFQLCSVPMYLCILLPVLYGRNKAGRMCGRNKAGRMCGRYEAGRMCGPGKACSSVLTFLSTYTFVGAVAALAVPEDFMRSYAALTLHGFIWHGMLLFISLTVVFSGITDLSFSGFMRSTALFAGLCFIAVLINVVTEPVMVSAHSAGVVLNQYAAMFYLNPYHISPQPIVGAVQQSIGIIPGLILYTLAIIAASGFVCMVFGKLSRPAVQQ